MAHWNARDVAAGTGGDLIRGPGDATFAKVSIDSRSLGPGDLFFAIRGARQDGHKFVPDALAKGALGAVVETGYEFPGPFPEGRVLIRVRDTHESLKSLAHSVRRSWPGTLVAVTGSMGKTTTKDFTAQVLSSQYSAYKTHGNYNNLFGLPLALLGLEPGHQVGVFEMGMSAPGEISEMCKIAEPDHGILTNVAPVHLAFFRSLEDIAAAKAELAQSLPLDGALVYNADDPLVSGIAGRFRGRRISFGFSPAADVRAEAVEIVSLGQTRFRLICFGRVRDARLPLAGAHWVLNALAAVALGCLLDIAPDKMAESLDRLEQPCSRGRILRFRDGFTVIDDSYNSNPLALMQMVQVLAQAPSFDRRILVAGEMLELGAASPRLHADCGAFAASQGIHAVVAVQGDALELARTAIRRGIPESQARFFAGSAAASDYLVGEVRKGDLVLVKGSRGVHTEKIVECLRSKFEVCPA